MHYKSFSEGQSAYTNFISHAEEICNALIRLRYFCNAYRSVDVDFLCMVLKVLLAQPDFQSRTKVIIMSATLEKGFIESYFNGCQGDYTKTIPRLEILNDTPHNITKLFLDEVRPPFFHCFSEQYSSERDLAEYDDLMKRNMNLEDPRTGKIYPDKVHASNDLAQLVSCVKTSPPPHSQDGESARQLHEFCLFCMTNLLESQCSTVSGSSAASLI